MFCTPYGFITAVSHYIVRAHGYRQFLPGFYIVKAKNYNRYIMLILYLPFFLLQALLLCEFQHIDFNFVPENVYRKYNLLQFCIANIIDFDVLTLIL